MSLHAATFTMLVLIAMGRLASIAAFATWEIQHARKMIGSVEQLTVSVVPMHGASFQD